MANCHCYYDLRAYGKTESVDLAVNFIKEHSPKIAFYDDEISNEGKTKDAYVSGWCKWSVIAEWNLHKYAPLNELFNPFNEIPNSIADKITDKSKILPSLLDIKDDISIELYTEEDAMHFAEHYIMVNGEIKLNDTRYYEELYDDDGDFIGRRGGFNVNDDVDGYDFNVDKQIPEYEAQKIPNEDD